MVLVHTGKGYDGHARPPAGAFHIHPPPAGGRERAGAGVPPATPAVAGLKYWAARGLLSPVRQRERSLMEHSRAGVCRRISFRGT